MRVVPTTVFHSLKARARFLAELLLLLFISFIDVSCFVKKIDVAAHTREGCYWMDIIWISEFLQHWHIPHISREHFCVRTSSPLYFIFLPLHQFVEILLPNSCVSLDLSMPTGKRSFEEYLWCVFFPFLMVCIISLILLKEWHERGRKNRTMHIKQPEREQLSWWETVLCVFECLLFCSESLNSFHRETFAFLITYVSVTYLDHP